MALDYLNWNAYYEESNAIVELHKNLEEEIAYAEKTMQLDKDKIYFKKPSD
jgi:hypothetical protein